MRNYRLLANPLRRQKPWQKEEYLNHGLLNSVPGFRVEGVCCLFRFDFQNIAVRPNYLGCFIFIKFTLGKVKCTGTN